MKEPQQIVAWRYPKRPLSCRVALSRISSTVDEPYDIATMPMIVRQMAKAAGIDRILISKDLRNGSVRGTVYLNLALNGSNADVVGAVLGHNQASVRARVTRDYIEPLQELIYNRRAEKPFQDSLAPNMPSDHETINSHRKSTSSWKNLAWYIFHLPAPIHTHHAHLPFHLIFLSLRQQPSQRIDRHIPTT